MSATGKMSDRAEVKLTILEAVVKGYHECSFAVHVGDKFVVKQKRGDRGLTRNAIVPKLQSCLRIHNSRIDDC